VAALDAGTGDATWTFTSLDPATLQSTTDPLAGLLPPNVTAPEGQGKVTYSVRPKAGAASGSKLAEKARIVFDANAPIDTNVWSNLIDDDAPTAAVSRASFGCGTDGKITVGWAGSDPTSAVATYD